MTKSASDKPLFLTAVQAATGDGALGYKNPRIRMPHSQVLDGSGGDGGACGRGEWESNTYAYTKDK